MKKTGAWLAVLFTMTPSAQAATTAENYDPAWISELQWAGTNMQSDSYFQAPSGSRAWLETKYSPWWQAQVAHPINNYDSSLLPVGTVRLDGALDLEYTVHRAKRSWDVEASPSSINNVYTFTPGSKQQEDQSSRMGQNAYFNFGMHPVSNIMGDIGVEAVGNYDQRYWFPVNDEHRMYNSDKHLKIVRGELKYDDKTFMIRGFEGTPNYSWVYQNDLFQLLPTALDVENYRRIEGSITPRGGEMRYASPFGTLNVLGGSEPRIGYGSAVYVKYDAPTLASWENTLVYRHEEVPFTLNPDEKRWTVSYNSSWKMTESVSSHVGALYQPFRLNTPYTDATEVGAGQGTGGSNFLLQQKRTLERDALGATWRLESRPTSVVDAAGLGYTYLGPVAGNKHQIDADASRLFKKTWTLSGAYIYRHPIREAVPLLYEGTPDNPGALISSPRGPDDAFGVNWENRESHIASLTTVYDPTPETPVFIHRQNVLEDWNINPDEDSTWVAGLQYRATYYPTNTDRMFYWDEDRNIVFDPIYHTGALASAYPYSSATGLVKWTRDRWHVMADLSGGQALAGNAIAYTPNTNYYKPSTTFMQGGLTVDNSIVKLFFRYAQDVWGPEEYQIQQGLTYHQIYQAGLSYIFLRDLEAGFRYVGTRMTEQFIGADTGAFNEYRLFLTYHFGKTISLGKKYELQGKPAMESAAPLPPPPAPAPPPAADAAFATTMTAEGLKLTLNSQVLFETGKNQLKPNAQNALDRVSELLASYPTSKLRISGHSDSTGSAAFNQKLSERRADAVAHYLATKGVSRSRMSIVGRGEDSPVASNETVEGRAANRRVEIDILK